MFKTIVIAICCLLIGLFVTGQETFSVSKGAYNDAGVVVAPVKMNILYIGIDNPVDIAVPGVMRQDVSAKVIGAGIIEKGEDNHYNIKVNSPGKCLVAVMVKGKEVSRTEFRVKRIPPPTATVGGKLIGGRINAQVLAVQLGLVAILENFDFQANFIIKSFSMKYSSGDLLQSFNAQGPFFTKEMKETIKKAKKADGVTFDEIIIIGPDTQPRKIAGITFTII
ncbi:MAG: hypothetical protein KA149_04730 [Chitinophagales bacterium]|nr:hypothetical protein [Chitinophagales bacterium]